MARKKRSPGAAAAPNVMLILPPARRFWEKLKHHPVLKALAEAKRRDGG